MSDDPLDSTRTEWHAIRDPFLAFRPATIRPRSRIGRHGNPN